MGVRFRSRNRKRGWGIGFRSRNRRSDWELGLGVGIEGGIGSRVHE